MERAAVIVGASGGIGAALVEAVVSSGSFAKIHAVSRKPLAATPGVVSHIADVTDEASVARAVAEMAKGEPVGLAIVATGLLHEAGLSPEKSLGAVDPAALARLFAVNAIGPALVAKHLIPLMPRRERSTFAAISARVGSIEDNRLGGWYGYRTSKAALNQLIRTLAIEVRRTRPEAVVLALHPGTVVTGLSKPFRGDAPRPGTFSPSQAAAHLLAVIDAARKEQSGEFLSWDGSRIPF